MFKFIKQYAETMNNAQIYPLFSLFIFFVFFVLLLIYVKKMDKKSVDQLSNIPFDNHTETAEMTIKHS
jgi:hypothetical protein